MTERFGRLRRDCAEGVARKVLGIFGPCLQREELMREAFSELMPVLLAALEDYDRKKARQEQRLA